MDIINFCHTLIRDNFTTDKYNDLLSFFGSLHYKNFKIKKTIIKEFTINELIGGNKSKSTQTSTGNLDEFVLDKYKFIARLIHGDATDIKGHTHSIKFISVDDINESSIGCAIVNFDYDIRTAYIRSIGDYNNCILCVDRKFEYKVGQILMAIIINICYDKPNIDYIELLDLSILNCMKTYKPDSTIEWNKSLQTHDTLNLKVISTLIKGEPYYSKYGFEPKDDDAIIVYKHNKKVFKKGQLLNTINVDKIIRKKIIDKKYIDIYIKYIIPLIEQNNNKPVCEFIKKIFEINPDPYTKSVICYIISKIYGIIYDLLDYKTYKNALFIKSLKD
jgi:hypothetical protein